MPAAFNLFRCMLVLAKPMKVAETVPSAGVMTASTKEQRLELRGSGLILHRELPLAKQLALAQERIREEMTQGCYVAWADQFCKSRCSKNPDGPRDISLSCTVVVVLTGLSVRWSYAQWSSTKKLTTWVNNVALHMRELVSEFLTIVQDLGSNHCPLVFFAVRWMFAGATQGLHHGSHTGYGTLMSPRRRDRGTCWSGFYKTIPGTGTQ